MANAGKFFGAIDTMFKQQDPLMAQTEDTLQAIGKQRRHGREGRARPATRIRPCSTSSQPIQKFANEELKVDATPTFFINGAMTKGAMSFEEFEAKLIDRC